MSSVPPKPVTAWKNIGVMRGLGIALVALNHAAVAAFSVMRLMPEGSHLSGLEETVELVAKSLTPACLPIFLFSSGYFTFRFSANWKAASSTAVRILLRYLLWAIPSFALFFAIGDGVIHWKDTLFSFLSGGPWPSYWFLVLLIQLSLVAPWVANGVKSYPNAAIWLCIVFESVASIEGYLASAGHSILPSAHLIIVHLPAFAFGMIFSARSVSLLPWLVKHRRAFGVVALLSAAASCAESVWLGHIFGDGTSATYVYNAERVTTLVFALSAIFWLVTLPAQKSRVRETLDWIGLRSVAVLLMMDMCIRVAISGLWHLERIAFGSARPAAVPPPWMQNVGLLLVVFAAALLVPVLAFHVIETRLGKRARSFLFG